MNIPFRPRLVDALRGYSAKDLAPDLIAGVTVGIVALPLAMAFAIASGVKPEAGIFTAVIAGFIISALGGTKVSIGGPTGAFIVILYGIGAKYGFDNLLICTILAGGLLVTMGMARIGTMIKFIPYPVTMGFTSGIAVLIFSTQIKDFLGLQIEKVPSEFVEKMKVLIEHVGTVQWPSASLAAASLAIILFWPGKWQRRVPGSIAALVLGTAAAGGQHDRPVRSDEDRRRGNASPWPVVSDAVLGFEVLTRPQPSRTPRDRKRSRLCPRLPPSLQLKDLVEEHLLSESSAMVDALDDRPRKGAVGH
jgi:MFS superfamily sulfate permease-like transporter